MKKKIFLGIFILLILLQFLPKGLPSNNSDTSYDLLVNNTIPPNVNSIIKNSCYDCHSNNTSYPWYAHISPVSFLVGSHVKEGREHLNFSEWEQLGKLDKAEALDDLMEEIEDEKMPIKPYLLAHPASALDQTDRTLLINWAEEFAESIFE